MPETRYIEVYDNQGNLIAQEPYEVSDEELAVEAYRQRINDLLHKNQSLTPIKDLREVVRYLAKREGLL